MKTTTSIQQSCTFPPPSQKSADQIYDSLAFAIAFSLCYLSIAVFAKILKIVD